MLEYGSIKWYEYGSINACMAVARQNVPCCKGHQLQMFQDCQDCFTCRL